MPLVGNRVPDRVCAPRILLIAGFFLVLCGCGGGGGGGGTGSSASGSATGTGSPAPVAQKLPTIASFSSTPSAISSAQSVTLSWSVANASSLSLSPAIGTVTGTSLEVTPNQTTTYTLTAVSGNVHASATTTVTVGSVTTHYANMATADLGPGANLNGAIPFPADNAWNINISQAAVDPNSSNLIQSIGLTTGLHPDFGAGLYQGAPIGIPYVIVSASQSPVPIVFQAYGDQSDPGPYPVPPNAPIEGQLPAPQMFGGDRHVLVVARDANRLYEMDRSFLQTNGSWFADSGALFHLDSDVVRPTQQPDWTSADAAGLPIFPGLARFEEANAGAILHALRFTVTHTRKAYLPPANHYASSNTSVDLPPMGMRVRLKAGYAIPPTFSPQTKAILQALKTYGMFVADNGSNWYISGAPDDRWNNDALVGELGQVTGSDFEVVLMSGIVTP